nr:ATP-binding protein [uncultured Draconibacterium sp.]
MNIDNLVNFLLRFIPYPRLRDIQVFAEWKNKVLILMLGAFVIIGPLAFVPGVFFAVKEGVWGLVVSNSIIYSVLLYITFSKRILARVKVLVSILMFFLLGISVFLMIGTRGSGFNWLFIFVTLACFFYGYKGLIYSEVLAIAACILLYIPIHFNSPYTTELNVYGRLGWTVNVLIFIAVSVFFAVLLNEMLRNLNSSLKKEQKTSTLLLENKFVLEEERNSAQKSDRLKSQFLANMSHEIRTPMNALLGFANMLGDPDLPRELVDRYRNIISISGEQLIRIIDDIIDISKIESNQMKIDLSLVDIKTTIFDLVEVSRAKVFTTNKSIRLEVDRMDELKPIRLRTDQVRFKQILTNLLDNAIKYAERGTVSLGYKIVDDGSKVEFFVRDEGPGIPPEEQKKIFDRFSQASNIEFNKGTGLGLSIVKGLLDLLGGEIWLESEFEKGSTFYFTLPIDDDIEEPEMPQRVKADLQSPLFHGKRVFIAEDDNNSFLLLERIVRLAGVQAKRANNGIELLEMLEEEIPDLILLDINMPEMNGLDALEKLREKHPELPVIVQTAYAMPEERKKCFALGCNDYIAKPIKRNALIDLLKIYLA